MSNDQVTSLDLTNPAAEFDFTVNGSTNDFQMFETTVAVPDGVRSFDLTFISGGAATATGSFYIDDISAALVQPTALLGDYNHDGIVDAADYTVWRDSLGQSGSNLAADGNHNGVVDAGDLDIWKTNFGQTAGGAPAGSGASTNSSVPEPSAQILSLIGGTTAAVALRRAKR
jgi:hypothetical protein